MKYLNTRLMVSTLLLMCIGYRNVLPAKAAASKEAAAKHPSIEQRVAILEKQVATLQEKLSTVVLKPKMDPRIKQLTSEFLEHKSPENDYRVLKELIALGDEAAWGWLLGKYTRKYHLDDNWEYQEGKIPAAEEAELITCLEKGTVGGRAYTFMSAQSYGECCKLLIKIYTAKGNKEKVAAWEKRLKALED